MSPRGRLVRQANRLPRGDKKSGAATTPRHRQDCPALLLFDDNGAGEYVVRGAPFGVEERVEYAETGCREREYVGERAARALSRGRHERRARIHHAQRAERHAPRAPRESDRARVIQEHHDGDDAAHRAEHARVAPVADGQLDCRREGRAEEGDYEKVNEGGGQTTHTRRAVVVTHLRLRDLRQRIETLTFEPEIVNDARDVSRLPRRGLRLRLSDGVLRV